MRRNCPGLSSHGCLWCLRPSPSGDLNEWTSPCAMRTTHSVSGGWGQSHPYARVLSWCPLPSHLASVPSPPFPLHSPPWRPVLLGLFPSPSVPSSAPCSWNLKWRDRLRGHRLPPATNTWNHTWNVNAEVLFMAKLKRKSLLQVLWIKTGASVLQRKMDRDSGSRGWEPGIQCLQDGGLGLRPQHKTWTTARIPVCEKCTLKLS